MLPYLEVVKDNEEAEQVKNDVQVPNIEGKSIKEAENILKENNLKLVINNEQEGIDKENTIIKEQIPKVGVKVKEEANIYVELTN